MSLDQLHMWVAIVATIKIVVSMTWFIVIASNLTMGVAWHRFLAFFNIYFKRNSDGSHSLGNLPELLSHDKPVRNSCSRKIKHLCVTENFSKHVL